MSVKRIVGLCCLAAGAALITAGCGISGLYSAAARPATGPPVTLTEHAAPSALVMVVDGGVAGPTLPRLVLATARPDEDLDIIGVGSPPESVVASDSPASAKVVVPGKPVPPASGATAYQSAVYRKRLKSWAGEILAGRQDAITRTQAGVSSWARKLGITARLTGLPEVGGDPGSMADECRLAAGAMAGLDQEAAGRFGGRRVILLYAANLGGIPQTAELAGDDVIVVTSRLPSAAVASTAQAKLLAAGAVRATVVGPEATSTRLAQLATAGLSEKPVSETLSGSVLFADHSAVLLPGAGHTLTPLLAPLRRRGATGVINGYAFADGDAQRDYNLSHARAVAVAAFLEARGVPASSLVVVAHGATHLVASASAGAESRVVVVIEEP